MSYTEIQHILLDSISRRNINVLRLHYLQHDKNYLHTSLLLHIVAHLNLVEVRYMLRLWYPDDRPLRGLIWQIILLSTRAVLLQVFCADSLVGVI